LPLSDDRLEALRNLSQKKAGLIVGWIDIAEARALTKLGFAERASSGWRITAEGEAALAQAPPVGTGNVIPSKR
jgi:hypothetical protein